MFGKKRNTNSQQQNNGFDQGFGQQMEPQQPVKRSIWKRIPGKVWQLLIALLIVVVFILYRKTTGLDVDTPVVTVDGQEFKMGAKVEEYFDKGYSLMDEDGYVYTKSDFEDEKVDSKTYYDDEFSVIKVDETAKMHENKYTYTGLSVSLANFEYTDESLVDCAVYKFVLDTDDTDGKLLDVKLELDGIPVNGISKEDFVKKIEKTDVSFEEEDKKAFLKGSKTSLTSRCENYEYELDSYSDTDGIYITVTKDFEKEN